MIITEIAKRNSLGKNRFECSIYTHIDLYEFQSCNSIDWNQFHAWKFHSKISISFKL